MNNVLWFLNYTAQPETGRTTETKLFDTLRDAKAYAVERSLYGYITRMDDTTSRVQEFVNGFEPSAQEQLNIQARA